MMLLSEAILLGIGGVKENRSCFLEINSDGPCGCAIGTALWAIGYRSIVLDSQECVKVWPWTAGYEDEIYRKLGANIATLISGRHARGESRESLAKWVAEKEKELGIVDIETKEAVKEGEHAPL